MKQIPDISKPTNRLSCGPSRWLAILVMANLGVTCLTAVLIQQRVFEFQEPWPSPLSILISSGSWGIQLGQITLLACWNSFGEQPWYLRMPRVLLLAVWQFLMQIFGGYLVNRDLMLFLVEEVAAYHLLLFLSPIIVLGAWRFWDGRRFILSAGSRAKTLQFTTMHLFLLTAEVAALLALCRVVLRWNRNAFEEFWSALSGHRPEELIPLLVSLTVLPAALYGLARRQTISGLLILMSYLIFAAFLLALGHASYRPSLVGPNSGAEWWQNFVVGWMDLLCTHASAAATILFTFYLLGRIGYDFRRRDEGPRGRSSSSNACNSVASASA